MSDEKKSCRREASVIRVIPVYGKDLGNLIQEHYIYKEEKLSIGQTGFSQRDISENFQISDRADGTNILKPISHVEIVYRDDFGFLIMSQQAECHAEAASEGNMDAETKVPDALDFARQISSELRRKECMTVFKGFVDNLGSEYTVKRYFPSYEEGISIEDFRADPNDNADFQDDHEYMDTGAFVFVFMKSPVGTDNSRECGAVMKAVEAMISGLPDNEYVPNLRKNSFSSGMYGYVSTVCGLGVCFFDDDGTELSVSLEQVFVKRFFTRMYDLAEIFRLNKDFSKNEDCSNVGSKLIESARKLSDRISMFLLDVEQDSIQAGLSDYLFSEWYHGSGISSRVEKMKRKSDSVLNDIEQKKVSGRNFLFNLIAVSAVFSALFDTFSFIMTDDKGLMKWRWTIGVMFAFIWVCLGYGRWRWFTKLCDWVICKFRRNRD